MMREISVLDSEKMELHEKCGLFAIWVDSPRILFSELLYGGIGVQNRGQNGAGMVVGGNACKKVCHKQDGLIKDIFVGEVTKKFQTENRWGIVQCRYGTNGNYSAENNQPYLVKAKNGDEIAVAHNGEFVGVEKYKTDAEMSDTRVFVNFLAEAEGKDWDEKVVNTVKKMKGAFSLIVGIGDSLYIIRDKNGVRPLLIGKIEDGFVVASETPAMENVRAKLLREVKPGEITKINENELTVLEKGDLKNKNECIFEFPYTRSPHSLYCDKNGGVHSIYEFRQRSGIYLAKQFREKGLEIDFVVGIPESGIPIAEGFHNELGVRMSNVIMKRPSQYYLNLPTRTFMNDQDMKSIPKTVMQKLSFVPDKSIYKGKRIACIDDSVVRSSTSKVIVETLMELGAKSVDWVSGLPMVVNSCHLGISIRSKEELIAFQKGSDQSEIAKAIGVRSITFITAENILRATNNGDFIEPKDDEDIFMINGFCGGCLGGHYPVSKDGIPYLK